MTSVLVIGAGIGGITVAARLARRGCQVTVVEKHAQAGGRCRCLVRDGHHFVTGPSLLIMPELYVQTFADLGALLEDHLDLRRVDPTYHLYFDDGSRLALTADLATMQTQLEAIETGGFGRYLRYLDEGHRHYNLGLPNLVDRNFPSLLSFCTPYNLLLLLRLKGLTSHYANIGNYFTDDRLKAAFTFQDMYVGLSPAHTPAIFSLLPYTELADGVWYPMGGMYRIIQALTDIAQQHGVQFVYHAEVERIDVEGTQATGAALADGRRYEADVIVTNADLPYVYRHLLPDDGTAARLARKRYSCSAVMFFWGVDQPYPQLKPHNLFLRDHYLSSFDQIFQDLTIPETPSFYVHAPVRIDPSLAPEDQDTLMAIVPVGHLDETTTQDWAGVTDKARQAVLQRLSEIGVHDLAQHIKFELCYTPHDWHSRHHLVKGATHGLSHNLTQLGYLRPHNRHRRYRNLYFVGASTHPGTGLPTVLISAKLTAERVLQEVDSPQRASIISRTASQLSHLFGQ